MSCRTEQEIYDYSLDVAEGLKDAAFEEHLQQCESCAAIFEQYQSLDRQIEEASKPKNKMSPNGEAPEAIQEELPKRIDEYDILKEISRGGMGKVLLAEDSTLQRLVAIKIIRGDLTQKEEFRVRFMTEARILAQLHHPNIVTIHKAGEDEAGLYLVMEHIEGQTLNDCKLNSLEEKLGLFQQILSGVIEAHQNNILHRDLKPSNMMLSQNGTLKILDFGIASSDRFSSGYTSHGQVMGTYAYLAPEILHGGQYTQYSDIYSLGIIFYQIISGQKPSKRMEEINQGNPLEKSATELGLILHGQNELQKYMEKFLELQPHNRYQSVQEAKDVLKAIVKNINSAQPADSIPINNDKQYNQEDISNLLSRAAEIKRKQDEQLSEKELQDAAEELELNQGHLEQAKKDEALQQKNKIKMQWLKLAATICIILVSFYFYNNRPIQQKGDVERLSKGMQALIDSKTEISFAILPFENGSGLKEWNGLAASSADSVMVPLSKVDKIHLIERLQLHNILDEIDFSQSMYVDPEFSVKLGDLTGADAAIMGSLQKVNDKIRIILRVTSTETGEIIYSESIEGPADDIFELQQQLGKSLANQFQKI